MLSNVEPGESSDELYSPENEEDETDLICNQQRERKRQDWRKQKRDKTKATTDLTNSPLVIITTNETFCIMCQKNKKGINVIWKTAGWKALFKSAEKKDDLVLARIRSTNSSDTFVYHSGNVSCKPYIFSKMKSQHEDEKVEDNEGYMMVEIDDVPSRCLRACGKVQ